MPKKPDISVSIISFNEEKNIGRTLKSVAPLAAEIILVDSRSTDSTVAIAESFGAKVFVEDWKGHIAQKNSALQKCSCEWVLSLDCDEEITPELASEIEKALENPKADGYFINRRTFYLGKLMKGAWQPDLKLRLVKRSAEPHWTGIDPHDALKIKGSTSSISGDLIHYSYAGIEHHFRKTIDYARISAESYFKLGRKFSLFKFLLNPPAAFIRLFFLNRGYKDGIRGVIAAFSSMVGTFLKYAFLFDLERNTENEF
jgi:glycosyltransferase involved in cell wall biosynthesis